jgi:hypothetical protein
MTAPKNEGVGRPSQEGGKEAGGSDDTSDGGDDKGAAGPTEGMSDLEYMKSRMCKWKDNDDEEEEEEEDELDHGECRLSLLLVWVMMMFAA